MCQVNVLTDSFYIWHSGPFATINSFRLGRTNQKEVCIVLYVPVSICGQVSWNEVNAGLGQVVLLLNSICFQNQR